MKVLPVILASSAIALFSSLSLCAKDNDLSFTIVPRPQSIRVHKKSPVPTQNTFKVKGADINYDATLDERSRLAIMAFASRLALATGKSSSTAPTIGLAPAAKNGKIRGFAFFLDKSMEYEEYQIDINDKSACICAGGYNGILYALQTLRQMLPVEIFGTETVENLPWNLPCVTIKDKPRFAYRGLHLDCARHFFSTEETKRILDIMSIYKLNRFHWHLTDDQGWRIEIKRFPELTQVGAFRNGTQIGYDKKSSDGIRYGGYYTQDQIRDVVAYAYRLGIEVIPEIDLPGHMQAALAAFPSLGCTGGPYEVWTNWGISKDVLCAGKEDTYTFLRGVLEEVCNLFPYKYVHIGGDECKKDNWKSCPDCQAMIEKLKLEDDAQSSAEQKLQTYLTGEIAKFLQEKGKTVVGWDEIREGGQTNDAVIMSWLGLEYAKEALQEGYDVILTPKSNFYFDYFQSEERDLEPIAGKRCITLKTVYDFDPSFGTGDDTRILGIQANLWSEYLDSDKRLEYMLLPRLTALSEVQWSSGEGKNYELFESNVINHEFKIFEKMGYFFSRVVVGEHNFER